MLNSNTPQTEMNNSSQSLNETQTLPKQRDFNLMEYWDEKYLSGIHNLFEFFQMEGYNDLIKFYKSENKKKEFLKRFKIQMWEDFTDNPFQFQIIWKHFKDWYQFKCDMIYNS